MDWNQTRYLFDSRPYGLFVFQGVDQDAVKSQTIASETLHIRRGVSYWYSKRPASQSVIVKWEMSDEEMGDSV